VDFTLKAVAYRAVVQLPTEFNHAYVMMLSSRTGPAVSDMYAGDVVVPQAVHHQPVTQVLNSTVHAAVPGSTESAHIDCDHHKGSHYSSMYLNVSILGC